MMQALYGPWELWSRACAISGWRSYKATKPGFNFLCLSCVIAFFCTPDAFLVLLCLGDGGGGHWLVRMEWRPARWSVCRPLLVSLCTIKSGSSLAPAHPGGPGKGAIKWLWCGVVVFGLVPSVLCQEIRLEEHLQNDLFCLKWDVKP